MRRDYQTSTAKEFLRALTGVSVNVDWAAKFINEDYGATRTQKRLKDVGLIYQ